MTTQTFGDLMQKANESGVSFETLHPGSYVAEIFESDYQTSSTGKPQIKTRWRVVAGPSTGFSGLWNYFTLTTDNPNALAIFYRHMTSLGITSEFLSSLSTVDPVTAMRHIAQALLNKTAYIKVKVDSEYNNNKIERINPVPAEYLGTLKTPPADPFAAAAAAPVGSPSLPKSPF